MVQKVTMNSNERDRLGMLEEKMVQGFKEISDSIHNLELKIENQVQRTSEYESVSRQVQTNKENLLTLTQKLVELREFKAQAEETIFKHNNRIQKLEDASLNSWKWGKFLLFALGVGIAVMEFLQTINM